MSLRQHRNFLKTNAAQFDEINEALNNYLGQENMAGTNLAQTQYKKGNDGIFRRVK